MKDKMKIEFSNYQVKFTKAVSLNGRFNKKALSDKHTAGDTEEIMVDFIEQNTSV